MVSPISKSGIAVAVMSLIELAKFSAGIYAARTDQEVETEGESLVV